MPPDPTEHFIKANEILDHAAELHAAAENYSAWAKFSWHFVWAAGFLNICMAIWNLWTLAECPK